MEEKDALSLVASMGMGNSGQNMHLEVLLPQAEGRDTYLQVPLVSYLALAAGA